MKEYLGESAYIHHLPDSFLFGLTPTHAKFNENPSQ